MARKSCIGKQNGTASPSIPPRMRFRPVPACFGRSRLFWLISVEIQDSADMGLLQIKLNLDLLKNLNKPKSIHHSFAQKHCSLLLHMMSCSSSSLTRGILWPTQSSLTILDLHQREGENREGRLGELKLISLDKVACVSRRNKKKDRKL